MGNEEPRLADFLHSKPLYYKEIDYDRIHIAYEILKPHIRRPTTIHIVGTNGKGSTGRIIAHLAYAYSAERSALSVENTSPNHQPSTINHRPLSVGHYTSPHILRFNERIWLNGSDASDAVLEAAHERLYGILGPEISDKLSYFEYTTLLAFVVFEDCDLVVLEAGLGGEYDATNVCDKELSVITPIGIDHQAFLGETIEEIAATKLRSIQKKALIASQPYPEVVEVAKRIAKEKKTELFLSEQIADSSEQLMHQKGQVIHNLSNTLHRDRQITNHRSSVWPDFLLQNARVAMAALEILGIPYDVKDLESLELFGRFYPWRENIRIDVGHNPLAAHAIVEIMEPDTVLIYNSLDDKDYEEVLRILKPKLKRVEIIRIDSQRAATLQAIERALKNVGLEYNYFDSTIDPEEHYLVFGSFFVVEAFLQNAEGRE